MAHVFGALAPGAVQSELIPKELGKRRRYRMDLLSQYCRRYCPPHSSGVAQLSPPATRQPLSKQLRSLIARPSLNNCSHSYVVRYLCRSHPSTSFVFALFSTFAGPFPFSSTCRRKSFTRFVSSPYSSPHSRAFPFSFNLSATDPEPDVGPERMSKHKQRSEYVDIRK